MKPTLFILAAGMGSRYGGLKQLDGLGPNGETTGRWRDGIFPEWFAVTYPNLERNIVLQERDDMPGFYRTFDVYNPDYLGSMFNSNVSSLCVEQNYTYIDATNPDKVWIPTFRTGVIMHSDYGMMSVASYVVENSDDFDPSIASVYGTLKEGVITMGHAKAIGGLDQELQITALKKCVRKGMSVRQAEQLARKLLTQKIVSSTIEEEYPESYSRLVEELERLFTSNFSVKRTQSGGSRIVIECGDDSELDALISRLSQLK